MWAYRHRILVWKESSLVFHAPILRWVQSLQKFRWQDVWNFNSRLHYPQMKVLFNRVLVFQSTKKEREFIFSPFVGGGEMISDVFLDHSTYAEPPSRLVNVLVSFFLGVSHMICHLKSHFKWIRFEAGTPAIGEAIGLGAAIDYLSAIGMQKIHDYEVSKDF